MFEPFRHLYRLADHYFREATKGISPYWDECRNDFLIEHPKCAACGTTRHLAVHHVKPIDNDVTRESDWTNLMTLCAEDHFRLGHGKDWSARVPDIREIVVELNIQPALRPLLEEKAHKHRVYFGKTK